MTFRLSWGQHNPETNVVVPVFRVVVVAVVGETNALEGPLTKVTELELKAAIYTLAKLNKMNLMIDPREV